MRPKIFEKRIAQKIYLGFVLPLAVLLVAGILVPIFVWFSLERFRTDYQDRQALLERAQALQKAVQTSVEDADNYQRYKDQRFRQELFNSRIAYRDVVLDLQSRIEETSESQVREALLLADGEYRRWYQAVVREKRSYSTGASTTRFAQLVAVARATQERYYPGWQRAELFRRVVLVVVPILAAVLSLLIGRAIALGITRPLEELTRAARALAEGADPDALNVARKRLPNDELGDLQRTFEEMARSISSREADLLSRNEQLIAARRRIEAVLNATNDGIVMLDRRGTISVVNKRFAFFFGLEVEELSERNFEEVRPHLLFRFQNKERVRERLKAILRDPESIADELHELVHPSVRTVRLFTAPVQAESENEGGEPELLGRIVVLRDVTRESEVDRMKTEFVSTVSHELRTPLTAIQGYVELILGGKPGPLTETQREFLGMMQGSTKRLTALISDLLDVSRIEADRIELRDDDLDYAQLVRQAAQMLEGEAAGRGLTLHVELPGGEPPHVRGDANGIQQVLTNLISNAIKYTPHGGKITLHVQPQAGFVSTCVADTGVGIPAEDHEKVFEKFYRADNSTTRASGGTGLGLAITRSIVERSGGSIWVESATGEGSRFWFTLPQVGENDDEALAVPAPGQLVLAIGSDSAALHRLAHALRPQGIIASAAMTPAEGLRRTRGLRPDALLLDPFATTFDARDFVRELRSDLTIPRQPPIFLYSLRYDIAGAELRDPLAFTLFPTNDIGRLGFEATVLSALRDGTPLASRTPVGLILGDEEFGALAGEIRALRQGANLLFASSAEEANRKLGPLQPTLILVDGRGALLAETGLLLQSLRERSRSGRIPLVVALNPDDPLLDTDVYPVVALGAPPLPVERLARSLRERLSSKL